MIWRRIIGTLAGSGLAIATIRMVELLGHKLVGAGADPAQATPSMLAIVLVGWVLATAVGGYIAVAFAKWRAAAWIIGGLVAIGAVLNQLMVPTPWWFSVLGIGLVLITARLVAVRAPADQRVAL